MKVPDYLSGVRPTQVSWRGRAISVQHINRNIRREERRLEWLRSRDEYVRASVRVPRLGLPGLLPSGN